MTVPLSGVTDNLLIFLDEVFIANWSSEICPNVLFLNLDIHHFYLSTPF